MLLIEWKHLPSRRNQLVKDLQSNVFCLRMAALLQNYRHSLPSIGVFLKLCKHLLSHALLSACARVHGYHNVVQEDQVQILAKVQNRLLVSPVNAFQTDSQAL